MKVTTYSHKYLKEILKADMIGTDLTCGGGNDTRFLADHIHKVYAFDIQDEAIKRTKEKTKDYQNIVYICASHATLDKYIDEKIDVAMFNLGYLPYSDENIKTDSLTTIKALEKLYPLLSERALVSIIFYRGHEGGFKEYYDVTKYLSSSPYKVLERYEEYKNPFEPVVYILTK